MKEKDIIAILQKVYDPEVPILDIHSMGLIYNIKVEGNNIDILMTFTSAACPMGEMIIQMVKNSITEKYPDAIVDVEITFEPPWDVKMIKDEDIKEIFTGEI